MLLYGDFLMWPLNREYSLVIYLIFYVDFWRWILRIQIAGFRDHEGMSKTSGKPYKVRIAKVIATDSEGVVEVGEIPFFEGKRTPLPDLKPNQMYEPVLSFKSEAGKLVLSVNGLKPISNTVSRAA